ncbi:MAG TPA: DUF5661 family protein [Actinomycetota bacterium]|nr:DUF5661 family protein [Actinomycetota bacterium]
MAKREFTLEEAAQVAGSLGIDMAAEGIDLEQFRLGLGVELEHGRVDPETDVSDDDPLITGKIALAHLREIPDYYTRLAEMETEAES